MYGKTSELNASQEWVSDKAVAHLKKINETVDDIREQLKKQIDRKPNEDIIFYVQNMLLRTKR